MTRTMSTVAALALVLAGCGDDSDESGPEPAVESTEATVEGVVEVRPGSGIIGAGGLFDVGGSCHGQSGGEPGDASRAPYFTDAAAELVAGAPVVVADEDGTTVGTGSLETGVWVAQPTEINLSDHVCEMPFRVDVDEAGLYEVTVADRDPVTVPAEEAGEVRIVVEAG